MKKTILILIFLGAVGAFAQPQEKLKYIRLLDIGVTSNAHIANTLTISTTPIDRSIKLERNDFGIKNIDRPLGFDMDSLSERYSVTDTSTYGKVLNFLATNKKIKHTISEITDKHLDYPTYKIIVDGKVFFYVEHGDVVSFFDSLIAYLKAMHCDAEVIEALRISKLG